MIRFVDMRAADIAGSRFAFFDTVKDRFVQKAGEHAWETWGDFEEVCGMVDPDDDQHPIDRFRGLCPAWVFDRPPAEGVCFRCLQAGHEPEECPRDAETVVFAVARALREAAAWRENGGDIVEPRALRNFADSIDPTSEDYDPKQDPLVSS